MVSTLQKKKISWYQKEVSLCNEGTDPRSNSDSGRIRTVREELQTKDRRRYNKKRKRLEDDYSGWKGIEEGEKRSQSSTRELFLPPPILSASPPSSLSRRRIAGLLILLPPPPQNRGGGGDWNWGGETQEFKDLQR